MGVKVSYCQGDIGSAQDRDRIIHCAWQSLGRIDVLINNAGVAPKKRVDMLDLDEEGFDYVMNINLKGTFFLSQRVVKKMITENMSDPTYTHCIITITSISASVVSLNLGEYCLFMVSLLLTTTLLS